jgi:transcriptional repressor NrdR
MRCPYCHVDNDRVLDTRAAEDGYMVRRKRVCNTCNRKFATLEKIEQLLLRIVKRDDTREPLDREKIRRGIERACSKRNIQSAVVERAVQDIEADIYRKFDSEVPASEVGRIVMKHLSKLDEVAYIRFASVYHEFHDAEDFIRAISAIAEPQKTVEPQKIESC